MTETQFLTTHIFKDLTNLNKGEDKESVFHFSEEDFPEVMKEAEYYGLGLYRIFSIKDGKVHEEAFHEKHGKKATDPKWYNKAFKTFSMREPGLIYYATYKVSAKLLKRFS